MATGTNAIALESEVKAKTGSIESITANLCCTKLRAIALGADSSKLQSYTDNLLVKYSDIYKNLLRYSNPRISIFINIPNFDRIIASSSHNLFIKVTASTTDKQKTTTISVLDYGLKTCSLDTLLALCGTPYNNGYNVNGYIAITTHRLYGLTSNGDDLNLFEGLDIEDTIAIQIRLLNEVEVDLGLTFDYVIYTSGHDESISSYMTSGARIDMNKEFSDLYIYDSESTKNFFSNYNLDVHTTTGLDPFP